MTKACYLSTIKLSDKQNCLKDGEKKSSRGFYATKDMNY